jgi:hypothetical protein
MASLPYARQNISKVSAPFAEFDAEFDVGSLLQFHVHAEVANVTEHMVTNTQVVQLPMFTQRSHLAH